MHPRKILDTRGYCSLHELSVDFSHVIELSGMPDGCVDLLSVLRIRVLWHREASDLTL
jgi:hypothetical protein